MLKRAVFLVSLSFLLILSPYAVYLVMSRFVSDTQLIITASMIATWFIIGALYGHLGGRTLDFLISAAFVLLAIMFINVVGSSSPLILAPYTVFLAMSRFVSDSQLIVAASTILICLDALPGRGTELTLNFLILVTLFVIIMILINLTDSSGVLFMGWSFMTIAGLCGLYLAKDG